MKLGKPDLPKVVIRSLSRMSGDAGGDREASGIGQVDYFGASQANYSNKQLIRLL